MVWPSGAALAAWAVPTLPPPPTMFSTYNCLPSCRDNFSAVSRANTSVGPPVRTARSRVLAAPDRFAPKRSAKPPGVRQYLLPDAEIDVGEVSLSSFACPLGQRAR